MAGTPRSSAASGSGRALGVEKTRVLKESEQEEELVMEIHGWLFKVAPSASDKLGLRKLKRKIFGTLKYSSTVEYPNGADFEKWV